MGPEGWALVAMAALEMQSGCLLALQEARRNTNIRRASTKEAAKVEAKEVKAVEEVAQVQLPALRRLLELSGIAEEEEAQRQLSLGLTWSAFSSELEHYGSLERKAVDRRSRQTADGAEAAGLCAAN